MPFLKWIFSPILDIRQRVRFETTKKQFFSQKLNDFPEELWSEASSDIEQLLVHAVLSHASTLRLLNHNSESTIQIFTWLVGGLKYDLIVKGGLLIDPSQGIKQKMDVAVSGSKVVNIEEDINPQRTIEVFDASHKIVTPGLIDFHAHVYHRVGRSSVDPDVNCLLKGVTTVVDAGTSGALNYHGFKTYVVEACRTRVLAFLHISDVGLTMGESIGELEDLRHLDFDRAVEVAVENGDVIRGIKIRVPEDVVGIHGPQCLRLAKEVARTVNMPLMVHPGNLPLNLPLGDVLRVLEKGDIMTHCYPPPYPPRLPRASIFNEDGGLIQEIQSAKERGVLFDVAHGRNNFSWETAENALNQGFLPTTISSDLTMNTVDICVHDLPTVMSKFIHLGMPLYDVIERCTSAPASLLGMNDRIGTLRIGAEADIAILKIEEGKFPLWDNIRPCKERRTIKSLLKTVKVFKGGKMV